MSRQKDVLDALMQAMEMEKETFDFYTKAEHKTFNLTGKRIFKWLAKCEEQHYLKLSELYASLDESGRWVFYGGSTITLETDLEGTQHVGFETGDLEALEIAVDIEKKGIAYYDELLRKISDPAGRTMLQTLRDEETEHIRVISEKLQLLQGERQSKESNG